MPKVHFCNRLNLFRIRLAVSKASGDARSKNTTFLSRVVDKKNIRYVLLLLRHPNTLCEFISCFWREMRHAKSKNTLHDGFVISHYKPTSSLKCWSAAVQYQIGGQTPISTSDLTAGQLLLMVWTCCTPKLNFRFNVTIWRLTFLQLEEPLEKHFFTFLRFFTTRLKDKNTFWLYPFQSCHISPPPLQHFCCSSVATLLLHPWHTFWWLKFIILTNNIQNSFLVGAEMEKQISTERTSRHYYGPCHP